MLEVIYLISRARPSGPINQALNILTGMQKFPDVHAVLVSLAPEEKGNSWLQRFVDNKIEVVQFMQPISKTWKCISMLEKYVMEHNVQVIHSAGYRVDFVSLLARCNAKKISTQRCRPDEIAEKFPKVCRPILEKIHLKMIKKMDDIVGCSYALQDIFDKEYNMNINAVQNGVDTDRFVPVSNEEKQSLRNKANLATDKRVYIVLGSLRIRKNISLIIEAFIKLNNSNNILLIVGAGPEEDKLKKQAEGIKNVIFTGNVTNPLEYLQMSDVLVSASLAEGLPNTVLEAMSCGLPTILSDICPHKELLTDKNYGALFKNNDVNELYLKLQESFSWNIEDMQKDVRRAAVEQHSIYKLAADYKKIYEDAINY